MAVELCPVHVEMERPLASLVVANHQGAQASLGGWVLTPAPSARTLALALVLALALALALVLALVLAHSKSVLALAELWKVGARVVQDPCPEL
jgi:hypothetical protein